MKNMEGKKNILITIILSFGLMAFGQSGSNRENNFKIGHLYLPIKEYVRINGYIHKTAEIPGSQIYLFPGLSGPKGSTIIKPLKRNSWREYEEGGNNRLCIYLTDTASYWQGLVSGLKSNAIPFRITDDLKKALRHKVIMFYPALTSSSIQLSGYNKIRDFIRQGGTVIGYNLSTPSLARIFGFEKVVVSNKRSVIRLDPKSSSVVSFCREPLEKEIRIGAQDTTRPAFETFGYTGTVNKPVAIFNDGSAAIIKNTQGNGNAYAFGFDLGYLTLICQANLDSDYQNSQINGFEPTLDVLYRIIKNIYLTHADIPVLTGMVPGNKKMSVLITHDVNTASAGKNAVSYAKYEKELGIKATYFVQTKYINDQQDEAFFNQNLIPFLDSIKQMGMEIASNGVTRTPFYNYMPAGKGDDAYPSYQPYFASDFSGWNETILGELRVSKFLLDNLLWNSTRTYRSGYLDYCERLYSALQATGYSFSSSVPANEVLTHLPFQAFNDHEFVAETDVYEFPITLTNDLNSPFNERLGKAIYVCDQIARYQGLVTIMIHPDNPQDNLDFLQAFIDQYMEIAWFGTVSEFGTWWASRNKVTIDATRQGEEVFVTVNAPMPIKDLPIILPKGLNLKEKSPFGMVVKPSSDGIIIESLTGTAKMTFGY